MWRSTTTLFFGVITMVDMNQLLNSLVQRGMSASSQGRIENSLGDDALANILEQQFGVARKLVPAGVPASQDSPSSWDSRVPEAEDAPSSWPSRVPTSSGGSASRPANVPQSRGGAGKPAGGGLPDLGGLFGKSFKQALGAGAMALLASIAMKALTGGGKTSGASRLMGGDDDLAGAGATSSAGLANQPDHSLAELTIKAMVNAAKADGQVDEDEFQKIVGELQGDQLTQAERDFFLNEVRKPMCTEEIIRAVPNRQAAAQIYAASLLAIEVDTPREEAYMQQLASGLGLDSKTVQQIHETLGLNQLGGVN
jgi:uncharacterized membrane protein YebE (DUF533 family)